MKKLTTTFLLGLLSFACFAQATFTEQTLKDIRLRMIADFAKYAKEETTSSFLFATGDGQTITGEQLKTATAGGVQMTALDYGPDVKIKQHDKVALVMGTNSHTMFYTQSGKSFPYHVYFTYLFEYTDNKWKWAAAQHTYLTDSQEDPKEVVKQWVKEYDKDNKAFFLDRHSDGFVGINGGGQMIDMETLKGLKDGITSDSEVSDMKSFRSGDMAVVVGIHTWHHKQANGTDKPDKVAFTYTMMKKNGRWLFVTMQHTPAAADKK